MNTMSFTPQTEELPGTYRISGSLTHGFTVVRPDGQELRNYTTGVVRTFKTRNVARKAISRDRGNSR